MNTKIILSTLLLALAINSHSQGKIKIEHIIQNFNDFIEISLGMDKPSNKFNLIDFDTIIVTDNKGRILEKNIKASHKYSYNNGKTNSIRVNVPKKKYKYLNIKGVMNYFKPSSEKNSSFNLGKIKDIKKNINLIPNKLIEQDSTLYFSITDSTLINKEFPNFRYRIMDNEEFKPLDFIFYNFIYAYRYSGDRKMIVFFDDNGDIGGNKLEIKSKNGINYKLVKTIKNIDDINIFLMIENEESIKKIPFEFKKIKVKN